jgi:hypothetical protein
MAAAPKRPGRSFSNERHLIELAKTSDLETIVKRTGRKPAALLKMAKRLGVSLKSVDRSKAKRR